MALSLSAGVLESGGIGALLGDGYHVWEGCAWCRGRLLGLIAALDGEDVNPVVNGCSCCPKNGYGRFLGHCQCNPS